MLASPTKSSNSQPQVQVQVQVQTNGWNDCPFVFSATRSRSIRRKRNNTGPSLAALNTAQGLISEDRSPKLEKSPQFIRRPPPLPLSVASTSTSSYNSIPNSLPPLSPTCTSTSSITSVEDAEALLSELLTHGSELSEKQFDYHKSKLISSDVISNEENRTFLAEILQDFFSEGKDYNQVESRILQFMMSHAGISWCVSLKKLLANTVD